MTLALVTSAPPALAYEATVDATFNGQFYQVTSPFGEPVLRRRRYTETLTLRMYDLAGPRVAGGPELFAVTRLRLDSDLGVDGGESSPRNEDRFVSGAEAARLDLMMAYVEGRNFARGVLGFRLGRQYVVDPLGFWSFDGALLRVTTPIHLVLEGYAGAEQRGGLYTLSTSRFEADGVRRGARDDLPSGAWPSYLDASRLAPAYGFALEAHGIDFLDAKVSYRKVVNRDEVVAAPFPVSEGNFETLDGDRTSSERIGAAASLRLHEVAALRGTLVYDALLGVPTEYRTGVDAFVSPTVLLGADVDSLLPSFDGDSMWNWFSRSSTTTVSARTQWDPTRRVSLTGSGGLRRFDGSRETAVQEDVLGTASARYRAPTLEGTLALSGEIGDRGRLGVADAALRRAFVSGRYDAGTRLTVVGFRNPLAPERDATTLTYVLSFGFRPTFPARLGVEWEHSMSHLVGHRLRVLAMLDVTVF